MSLTKENPVEYVNTPRHVDNIQRPVPKRAVIISYGTFIAPRYQTLRPLNNSPPNAKRADKRV